MALAGRSSRRGAGARWLAVGIVVTLLVLFIDASLHSRSPSQGRELAAGAWLDRVLPVIAESNTQAAELSQLWSQGLQMKAPQFNALAGKLTADSAASYKKVVDLRPPRSLAGASGLLEACLLARSQATALLDGVFHQAIGDGSSRPDLVSSVQTAGDDLQIADQAYKLFKTSMPKVGVAMPDSTWLADPNPFQPQPARAFLDSLHSAASTTPLHQVAIYAVSTTPSPVSEQNGVQVLPDARAITVTIVVADTGNQPEGDLTVTASISPSAGTSSVRDFVNLVPGQAHTILNLGPLNPPQGTNVTLVINVTPPAASTTPPATKTIVFSMPTPPPSTTSTSTPPTTAKSGH